MSLQCPSSPIYNTSAEQKRNARNAAKMYRFGTPKLRDMLREKCRKRMREARQSNFEQQRGLSKQMDIDIKEILRLEVAELEKDLKLQEEIYNELVDEFNDWYIAQLEHEETYLIDMNDKGDGSTELLCPVCMQKPLKCDTDAGPLASYSCECGAAFQFVGDMPQLNAVLQAKIDAHEQTCLQPLRFFVEPPCLSGICYSCDYFCSLH